MKARRLTIKSKITLWYASFLLILLVVFSIILYFTISGLLYKSNEDLLRADADQVTSILRFEGNVIRFAEPYKIISTNTYFVVFDMNGNANLESEILPELVNLPIEDEEIRYITIDDVLWAAYDKPLKLNDITIGWIRVSRSMESLMGTLNNLKLILFISIPLYILFASLGGLFLANRALRPIDDITKTAGKISKGDLKQRLKTPRTEDEVGRLTVTFNEMLDKLEAFIKKERQFTSDASHELRTPLAIISAHAEQSLSGSKGTKEYKDALKKILEESKKMSYVISQLLMLYRSEEGKYKLDSEVLDLNVIVEEIMKEYGNLALEKEISVDFKSGEKIKIKGDQTLITRLIINLVDNAINYSKESGRVSVSLTKENNFAIIKVEDSGTGIAGEDLPFIFDRFYQADRARGGQGSGLGLSIVKWIVEVHKGEIEVESKLNQGTRFIIKLPLNL
ncbi:MAG: HAMP domain-containing sensor histidine kinase [Actinomycetota bacterium]|nr:HAMP domain-containing sensor histidine kinase [Actinomycetota bacterium]